MADKVFSKELEAWLQSSQPKTLGKMGDVFGEKSFAITVLLLMFLSALPIPTGGITNVFEVIVMLLALEMVLGLRTIWLPKRWQKFRLPNALSKKAIPFINRRIQWFERFSRPRLGALLNHREFLRIVGVLFLIMTLAAFLSPPFSGLDTLPSLGVVVIALSLILEDVVVFGIGCAIGAFGVGLLVGLSAAVTEFIQRLV